MRPPEPGRYGRVIVRGGSVERVVEWADASEAERARDAVQRGRAVRRRPPTCARWLRAVQPTTTPKGEYYLTDCVALAAGEGKRVAAVEAPWEELRGINSRVELAEAEATVQRWLRRRGDGGRRHADRAGDGVSVLGYEA